ncbi:unnamed protein product [Nippostrongylus brasiliensis]|uniref:DUF5880 domain-containing protein n=1 Tax=Nippostrongylus brasiliensis TaxID=27835 RepID=A0A0N4YEU3_NIPBR|nr:unnamed protein product [Nippostrongylus brasiliensis]
MEVKDASLSGEEVENVHLLGSKKQSRACNRRRGTMMNQVTPSATSQRSAVNWQERPMSATTFPAREDTGVLASALDRGIDVDALRTVSKSKLTPVYDASNNRMDFLGAVFIEAEVEGGDSNLVAFHIAPENGRELLIGTNALNKLGVSITISKKEVTQEKPPVASDESGKVVMVGRRYVPPGEAAWVEVLCEGSSEGITGRIIWPNQQGITAGVYRIQEQQTEVQIFNNSKEPMILREGWHKAVASADRTRKENKELRKEIQQLREERARVVVIADSDDVTSGDDRPPEPSERDEDAIPKKRKRTPKAAAACIADVQ